MPDGWGPVPEAFIDGLELGVYAGLVALLVLLAIAAVRRVLEV